jgi:menaquinone-9 beta-reductase
LLPESLPLLDRLGIPVSGLGVQFHGIGFVSGGTSFSASFPAGVAAGVRRTALHSRLVARAESLGVDLRWEAKAVRLAPGGISLSGTTLKFDFVVGADGQNSQIRKQAGLHDCRSEFSRYGFRKHYRIAPWSPLVEVYWGTDCQFYVTPVASDEVCLALLSRDHSLRIERALPRFPALQQHLANAPATSREKGALTVSRVLRRVHSGCVALLGDASGSVDAITGDGLNLAFKQSIALTEAISAENLASYEIAHRNLSRTPRTMSSFLLSLDKYPAVREKAFSYLERRPELFASLLGVHVGEKSFADLLPWRRVSPGRESLCS